MGKPAFKIKQSTPKVCVSKTVKGDPPLKGQGAMMQRVHLALYYFDYLCLRCFCKQATALSGKLEPFPLPFLCAPRTPWVS